MRGEQRLLIVDDEHSNRDLLTLMFEDSEFDTVQATDGKDASRNASKIVADCRCDAILLDWMMPEIDGFQLLRALKADPPYSNIPVIMHTARRNEARVKEALAVGECACVVKPFEPSSVRVPVGNGRNPPGRFSVEAPS